jgi:hypothetical protein
VNIKTKKNNARPIVPARENQENSPDKLKNLEWRAILERIQHSMEAQAIEVGAGATPSHGETVAGKPVQAWLPICPMPTDFCRVSPMDKGLLRLREYLENLVIIKTTWGRISYIHSTAAVHLR